MRKIITFGGHLFSGFQKKTQKTPQIEIDRAKKIKEEYYAYKRSSNQGL